MKGIGFARRQAKRLISRLKLSEKSCEEPAADLEQIAKELRISIVPYPFPEEISGVFFKKDGKLLLGVNEKEPENRRRFTIAHEIGHYVLHPSSLLHYDRPEAVHFRAKNILGPEEREANYFAAELLMPEELLTKCIAAGMDSVPELASRFKVSEEAMGYRLANLGFI